jgi:hypothetical protein
MKLVPKNNQADAVIVLANLMDHVGLLNHESMARVDLAVDILKSRNIKYLVTTGWAYRPDSEVVIANSMKNYIVSKHKINIERILVEPNARDTVGDAYFTKVNLAILRNWERICIVTSKYHAYRAKVIFNYIYGENFIIEVFPDTNDSEQTLTKAESLSLEAFYNTFNGVYPGDDLQIYNRIKNNHPYYNGMIFKEIL